jgi:hypothetical protein
MGITITRDQIRSVILQCPDPFGTQIRIPEDYWPSVTHGDDDRAAREWAKLTHLPATIRTEIQTTVVPPNETQRPDAT